MSTELGTMAEQAELRLLRYLLEMVRLEAEALTKEALEARRTRRPRPRADA